MLPSQPPFRLRAILIGLSVMAMVALSLMLPTARAGNPALQLLVLIPGLLAAVAISLRTLPLQNTLAATAVVGCVASLLEFSVGFHAHTPIRFTWHLPLSWIVAILLSRLVSAWLLEPWRNQPNFGLWLLGLTCPLAAAARLLCFCLADLDIRPGATDLILLNSRARFIEYLWITAVSLLAATPWFIKKRPASTPIPAPDKEIQ